MTSAIPLEETDSLDVTVGSEAHYKARIFYGDNCINDSDQWGFWIDALNYGADGFKNLDSGGDSGFSRNDINTKVRWSSDNTVNIQQRVELKLGYVQENADETYLGLSEQDFNADSNRGYAASVLDQFDSEHWQAHILYQAKFNDAWQVNTKAYVNRFDRQ